VKKVWGVNMQRQRKVVGMSQVQLAAALGVTQSTVSRWESGEAAPTVENQLSIARALRIDARVLFAFPTAA
jgi:transcriptional regulator with XRE-family HTH domain